MAMKQERGARSDRRRGRGLAPRLALVVAVLGGLAHLGRAQDGAPIQLGPSCVTAECHADINQGQFLHGPVNMGQCQPCHVPVNNQHVFEKPAGGEPVCLLCHETEQPKAVVHAPFAADCAVCHDPHNGGNRYFVKGGLGAESCNQCHSDVSAGLSMLHGPVAVGECLVCHTPHQSEHAHLLVEPRATLCQSCHTDVQAELENAVSVHTPVKQDCAGCHNAHGGNREYFLVAEGQDLCRKCHEPFLKQMSQFKHPHEPMTEGKGCVACHEAHVSSQEQLLKAHNMELCLSCHNETIAGARGMVENIQAQIGNARFLHGPLREDNCIACHQAHGSDHPNILEKAFPDSFYTSFESEKYDLCFACHDKQIILEEKTAATGFRNGEQNLHYLHVNREKGRSCRACHHEHAANQPNHIREEVPFGRWRMQVEFEKTETGGSCSTGCHVPYKYDRASPVQNVAARE